MQLVDHKKRSSNDELETALYAALIDSMLQNFWPMFIGSLSTAIATVMTALKTGNLLIWPCAVLIIGIGTVRACQMRGYERRSSILTFDQAKHLEPRYAVGAMVYAGALGAWCAIVSVAVRVPTRFGSKLTDTVHHPPGLSVTPEQLSPTQKSPGFAPPRSTDDTMSGASPVLLTFTMRPDVASPSRTPPKPSAVGVT